MGTSTVARGSISSLSSSLDVLLGTITYVPCVCGDGANPVSGENLRPRLMGDREDGPGWYEPPSGETPAADEPLCWDASARVPPLAYVGV